MARSAKQIAAQHKASLASARARRRAKGFGLPKSDVNYMPRNDSAAIRMESLVMHADSESAATSALKNRFSAKGRADAVRSITGLKKKRSK